MEGSVCSSSCASRQMESSPGYIIYYSDCAYFLLRNGLACQVKFPGLVP